MSIFDAISGNLSSLSDSLAGGFLNTQATQSKEANAANQDYKTIRQQNLLGAGLDKMGANPRPGQYQVTPTKAPVSVDPNELQTQWLRRLDNYAEISAKTGVKTK